MQCPTAVTEVKIETFSFGEDIIMQLEDAVYRFHFQVPHGLLLVLWRKAHCWLLLKQITTFISGLRGTSQLYLSQSS